MKCGICGQVDPPKLIRSVLGILGHGYEMLCGDCLEWVFQIVCYGRR